MPSAVAGSVTAVRIVQTTVTQALRLALSAAATILIARTLQPEGRGAYAMITTTATIAIVAGHLSMNKSQIAMWHKPALHRFLAANGLVMGIILGALSALCTFQVVVAFGLPVSELLLVTLLAVPFGVASINLAGIALLQFRTGLANRSVVASALALALPVATLAVMNRLTLTGAVIAWTVSTMVPSVLFVRSLGLAGMQGKASLAWRQLGLSSRYHIGLLAQHLLLNVDIFLLNALISPAEVGLYAVAGAFMALAWVPTDAITQVTLHRQAVEDEPDASRVTARALRFNLLLSSLAIAGLAIASPVLIPLLYGPAYAGSVAPLLLLAPGAVALSLARPAEQFLVRLGRPLTMALIPVVALAGNVAMNVVLVPRWGASGAAVSASVSYAVVAGTKVAWFARASGAGWRELLPQASDLRAAAALLPLPGRAAPKP
ncbi:polysaccharide biosynthesis C-terminal domain-containing protein [Nonomuraea sp. NPDC005501]|uniref:lipopolysaccharide biosynthesis protein n=1 Tax=Nonomuraea sp. NPDC005501 TaxID=3156884 RepID=UPI0033B439C6